MSKNLIIFLLYIYQLLSGVANAYPCFITSNVSLNFNCPIVQLVGCMSISNITFQCNIKTSYFFSINQGSSGNYILRTMVNTSNPNKKIWYNIYAGTNQQSVIGDGTQGSSVLRGSCTSCVITLYGYINKISEYPLWEGVYTDNLVGIFNYD